MALIIVGGSFTFPDGGAATNRVYTHGKGLSENGEKVYIICFRNDYLDDNSGEAVTIKYFHLFRNIHKNVFRLKSASDPDKRDPLNDVPYNLQCFGKSKS